MYLLKIIASENETVISCQAPIIVAILDFLESYHELQANHKLSLLVLSGDLKTRLSDFNSELLYIFEMIRNNREEIINGVKEYNAFEKRQQAVEGQEIISDDLKREGHELYKKLSGVVVKISSLIYALQETELVEKATQERSRNLEKLSNVDKKHDLKLTVSIKAIARQLSDKFACFMSSPSQLPEKNASLFDENICALKGIERALEIIDE